MAKILIVDDEADIRDYLETLLKDNNYETCTAVDGIDGMAKVEEFKPDLITLDIVMPGETGIKMYRKIKKNENLKKIPVIISTGIEQTKHLFAKDHKTMPKPEGYFEKPIDEQEFLKSIKILIG